MVIYQPMQLTRLFLNCQVKEKQFHSKILILITLRANLMNFLDNDQ